MSKEALVGLGILFFSSFAMASSGNYRCNKEEECEKNFVFYSVADTEELQHQLRPLFHLNFDYGTYIVNLTPQFFSPLQDSKSQAVPSLVFGDFTKGFQKTVFGQLELGLGAQISFWYDNFPNVAKIHWSYVGVTPLIGFETESIRYASNLKKAQALGGRWKVPAKASDLDVWDVGDTIAFAGRGGVLFSAGTGVGPVGVGAAKLAVGTWETFVEKVEKDKVYVKSSRGQLKSFSMFVDALVVNLKLQLFDSADDGFSFLFDLTTEAGRKTYEDVIRGNVLAAERWTQEKPMNFVERVPVLKVETFRTVSTGKMVNRNFSIPLIWDRTYSKGKVQVFNTSDMYIDRNTARVHYGIFSENEKSQFWQRSREVDFMFYGAKYAVEKWDSKARMTSAFGTYSYSFKQEDSNKRRLTSGIQNLIKKTGLEILRVQVPDRKLGYTGFEFNVNFEEVHTRRLMELAQRISLDRFIALSTDQIFSYFYQSMDPYGYCSGGVSQSCVNEIVQQTSVAVGKMYSSLRKMNQFQNTDFKAFSAAYGNFGEGMAENLFTFKTAMRAAGAGVRLDYLIEGTYISMFFRSWVVDSEGRLVAEHLPIYKGMAFEPTKRHSRVRGLIVGRGDGERLPQMEKVIF